MLSHASSHARHSVVFFAAVLSSFSLRLPAAQSAPPADDSREHTVRLLNIPRALSGGAEAVVLDGNSIYIAGKSWNKEEDKESLWLWRLDKDGNRQWEKQIAQQTQTEELRIVSLLPGANKFSQGAAAPGVRLIYRQALDTEITFIKSDGDTVWKKSIGALENTHGLVPDGFSHMFLFGRSMTIQDEPSHAWVARVTRLGTVLWKHTFDAGDQSDLTNVAEDSAIPKGFYQGVYLFDGTLLEDGSVVIAGQTGIYNKFGQGPSKLWLLRIDRSGKKLAEAFIDDGRIFQAGRDLIATCGDGVIAPYTKDQLPPIASAPGNFLPEFGIRLTRFDATLQKQWDKPTFVTTNMPGAATITGPVPFISLAAPPGELLIHAFNEGGDEVWKAKVATPDGFVVPLTTLRAGNDLIAVCNYRVSGSTDAEMQVLLVYVKLPIKLLE